MPGIFAQYDSQDLNRLAAKGILEKLRNIRQRINVDFTARRLLWELIQNAKDNVATNNINGNSKVKIEIEIEPTLLSFSHNNGYFKNENIRGLIRRYSSSEKDRVADSSATPPATTGRFGTGFMTTHVLSEKVNVDGFYQENDTTFRKFELLIDRTGQTEMEIIQSIESSFNIIENSINKSENFDISAFQNFKTQFKYNLNNEGYELAKISISEFDDCVALTLINISNIERITVKDNNISRFYEINKIEEYSSKGFLIEVFEVSTNNHKSTQKHFATIIYNNTRIVIPIKYSVDKIEIQVINKNIPKLFLDFPLIGTEDLNIPFVINNPLFEPTEARDGVSLTGGNDKDTLINTNILTEAFDLFKVFIDYISYNSNWSNLYNVARVKRPKDRVWINQEWYNKLIISPFREYLLKVPIVELIDGSRVSIEMNKGGYLDFPYHNSKEIRDEIWELCNFDNNFVLSKKEHIHEWYDIIWDKKYYLTIETIILWANNKNNIDTLQKILEKKQILPINWLNKLYKLISQDENVKLLITQSKVKIIPNQLGEFCFLKDLVIDDNIEDHLKVVLKILNEDIRSKLCYRGVNILNNQTNENFWNFPSIMTQENAIENINKIIKYSKSNNKIEACSYLISLFSSDIDFPFEKRNNIFNYWNLFYSKVENEKKIISSWSNNIWLESDEFIIQNIVLFIAQYKNVETSYKKLNFDSKVIFIKWLNQFISFLLSNNFEKYLNYKNVEILPNQNGKYCIKDDLFLDEGNIDESLKDIANDLGYYVREELLAKEIFLELPEKRIRNQEQVALEISKLIKPVLRDVNEREEKKDTIRKLYLWMNKNREIAEKIFGEIYEKRFLLISDDEIISNIEKAEILDEIIGETGLSPIEIKTKLLKLIKSSYLSQILENEYNTRIPYNIDLYPFGSESDIQFSANLMDFSSEKSRISISQDAKDIIFETLKSNGFIVPNQLDINFTIVNGIKNPSGYPIKIIVKSGKAGKIYFNPSEWLVLSESDTQLFVVTCGNIVRNVTLEDLITFNDNFHMRFNTQAFAVDTNLKAFANFFQFLPYTHFIFNAPESTTDFLKQFGLNVRNPSSRELTSDDKNLLH